MIINNDNINNNADNINIMDNIITLLHYYIQHYNNIMTTMSYIINVLYNKNDYNNLLDCHERMCQQF